MRTPRRARPNDFDLADLKAAMDHLDQIMMGLKPATPEYRATERAYFSVLEAARLWTGNPALWASVDSTARGPRDAWIKRPEHEKWPT